jgi:hypothetical protein
MEERCRQDGTDAYQHAERSDSLAEKEPHSIGIGCAHRYVEGRTAYP